MLLGGEQGNGRDAGPVAGVKEGSASDSEGMSETKSRPPLMKNDQLGAVSMTTRGEIDSAEYGEVEIGIGTAQVA